MFAKFEMYKAVSCTAVEHYAKVHLAISRGKVSVTLLINWNII